MYEVAPNLAPVEIVSLLEETEITYYDASIRRDSSFDHKQAVREMLEAGVMPGLDNGFTFVVDRRPAGEEENYIPAEEYTRYFSERQIPIADVDHRLRFHDVGHIPSYQNMFVHSSVADLVSVAATNALPDADLCAKFTKAMDGLGDSMRNLEDNIYGFVYVGDVNGARLNLRSLIELATPHLNRQENVVEERQTMLDALEKTLALDEYRKFSSDFPRRDEATFYGSNYRAVGRRLSTDESYSGEYTLKVEKNLIALGSLPNILDGNQGLKGFSLKDYLPESKI